MEGAVLTSVEDTLHYSSDSSSELDEEEESAAQLVAESQVRSKKDSWYKRLVSPKGKRGEYELSIQSGDIIRSPTPLSQASSPSGFSPTVPASLSPTMQPVAASSTFQGEIESNTLLEPEPAAPGPPATSRPSRRGGLYGFLFPYVHATVRCLFYSFKLGCLDVPLASIGTLLLNLILVLAVLLAIMLSSFRPRINMSIKSFGIPDHPAQVHWDAFNAAKSNKFADDSPLIDSALPDEVVRKRRSSSTLFTRSAYPNCELSSSTQNAIHKNWEMDLVFRVPSDAAKEDDNILRQDRITYIHSIEEAVYNCEGYENVCRLHRESGTSYCYPLSSLLSWLYLRDPKTGNYVYNTTDRFTPDLPSTLRAISNLSVALWFTGGEANFSDDFSFVEAKLLRSQIRVGLPLRCYRDPYDRNEEQKRLVTEYFISLMPMFEKMSTR